MKTLTQLADEYGSDKGIIAHGPHNEAHKYSLIYDLLFSNLRSKEVRLLEMGLLIGGPENGRPADRETNDLPSIRMWLEFFPKAKITGLDISDFSWFEDNRFKFVKCDMNERQNIRDVLSELDNEYDVIIDDASHASTHQQFGFLELFPLLKKGGLYIIEDLHWQPKFYERQHQWPTKTGELFWSYIRGGEFEHKDKEIQCEFNSLKNEIGFCYIFPEGLCDHEKDKILVVHKI